jgi:hypothetical protein
MEEKKFDVRLTLEELKLLDGKVSKEVQKVIDRAKKEAEFGFELPFMNEVMAEALEIGRLTWRRVQLAECPFCDKQRRYHPYTRTTHNHQKGEPNLNRPIYYEGVDFNDRHIWFKDRGDVCLDCLKTHRIIERMVDYIWDHDLKIEIQKNSYRPTKYELEFKSTDEKEFRLNPELFPEIQAIRMEVKSFNEYTDGGMKLVRLCDLPYTFVLRRSQLRSYDVELVSIAADKKEYAFGPAVNPSTGLVEDETQTVHFTRILDEAGYKRVKWHELT